MRYSTFRSGGFVQSLASSPLFPLAASEEKIGVGGVCFHFPCVPQQDALLPLSVSSFFFYFWMFSSFVWAVPVSYLTWRCDLRQIRPSSVIPNAVRCNSSFLSSLSFLPGFLHIGSFRASGSEDITFVEGPLLFSGTLPSFLLSLRAFSEPFSSLGNDSRR